MPVAGFKCEKSDVTGRDSCSPEECMKSCLSGDGCRPPTYMATVVDQMGAYSNSGTISGSGLLPECDWKVVKEKTTDFLIYPADLHWASFRGALVHEHLEKAKTDPRFKDWSFEQRYYAAIIPKGAKAKIVKKGDVRVVIDPKLVVADDEEGPFKVVPLWVPSDKPARVAFIDKLRQRGIVVLSGQTDAHDVPSGILYDYKTTRFIRDETKESYVVQTRFYAYLLILHGYTINRIVISYMDASEEDSRDIDLASGQPITQRNPRWREVGQDEVMLDGLEAFVQEVVIPTARKQRAMIDGKIEPQPTINYLCLPKKETGRIYCRVQSLCPAWTNVKWVSRDEMKLEAPSKCYGCYYYKKKDEREDGQPSGTCPSGCPNIKEPIVKVK